MMIDAQSNEQQDVRWLFEAATNSNEVQATANPQLAKR
jgi:hypothetical protein